MTYEQEGCMKYCNFGVNITLQYLSFLGLMIFKCMEGVERKYNPFVRLRSCADTVVHLQKFSVLLEFNNCVQTKVKIRVETFNKHSVMYECAKCVDVGVS